MFESFKVIKAKDPAVKSYVEVLLYPSFWAMLFYRLAHPLYNIKLYFLARLLSQLARLFTGIEIHPGAKIGKNFFIDHGMGVVIGETCEIGNNVLVYQGVTLGGTGKNVGKRHPTIGDNVLIGAGVKVLGPFLVGDNVRIGAGSVVLQAVPPNCTVVGNPARVVKRENQAQEFPSDIIDQTRYPDPIQMEICKLERRIEELEKKLSETHERENDYEAL